MFCFNKSILLAIQYNLAIDISKSVGECNFNLNK